MERMKGNKTARIRGKWGNEEARKEGWQHEGKRRGLKVKEQREETRRRASRRAGEGRAELKSSWKSIWPRFPSPGLCASSQTALLQIWKWQRQPIPIHEFLGSGAGSAARPGRSETLYIPADLFPLSTARCIWTGCCANAGGNQGTSYWCHVASFFFYFYSCGKTKHVSEHNECFLIISRLRSILNS